jgi:hypothetical protein
VRGWLDYLVAGEPWRPVRGRAPERIARPPGATPWSVVRHLLLTVMFAVGAVEDGWLRWVARAGLLVMLVSLTVSWRDRALYRTAVSLPPGEHDVLLTGVTGRTGRARRTLRKVFGVGLRRSVALTRAVTSPAGEPVCLVRGTRAEAAAVLAHRLREGGATVDVVPAPDGETVASFRP